ncbi:BtrH N-terminal domain-containing protein [Pseudochryseolinea flava]|uniref:Lantibiotic ABC transporter n=1 Tax=Pseudochryseolinea flava TaxID=2059302 RepID=A0A364Y9D5_9BACT|nr:BtrH N-terminal domain-containing protein [Pseudochryseolinea flava]RAW02842.1 lantibiotic ABC transporter [Pseudochryseolinea flava]
MIIKNIAAFDGQHCETTTTGTLLRQLDINLSEPMLFGLGEGLAFIFWKMKAMDYPFIGGRVKPDVLTQNICRHLKLDLVSQETTSISKAWENVTQQLDKGIVVGLKLDCYYLEYFSHAIHFAGHYAAMYGYDQNNAYMVDTCQQGALVKTSLKSLASARAAKGPMSSKNLSYTITKTSRTFDLQVAIQEAIRNNANAYLNPPINNINFKGIKKASTQIIKWFKSSRDITGDFSGAAALMEKAGTGGALFRNLYRDFLKESFALLKHELLEEAHQDFIGIAGDWTEVSKLFLKTSETKDIKYIEQASEKMNLLSSKEKEAMEKLARI